MRDYAAFVPVLVKDALLFEEFDPSGNYKFVARQHPELNYVSINKTAKRILDLCAGNSIATIVSEVINLYPSTDKNIVQADVLNSLRSLWRLGVITWTGSNLPFDLYLFDSQRQVTFSFLPENALVRFYQEGNVHYTHFASVNLDYAVETSEKFIRASWYSYSRLYYGILANGEIKAVLCLSYNTFLRAFDVLFLDVVGDFTLANDMAIRLMDFAFNNCKKNATPIARHLRTYSAFYFYAHGNNEWVKKMAFTFCGELKKEFSQESTYIYKLEVPSLDI